MGLKLVVRFAYNYEAGGADAPLDVVLAHIDQLGPVLREHRDVILVIESGFVGAWGEWHSSTNGLDTRAAKERILRRPARPLPARGQARPAAPAGQARPARNDADLG
jgi:hypothetical protein